MRPRNLLVILLLIMCLFVEATAFGNEPTKEQTEYLKKECQKYDLAYTLVYGVIKTESDFNPSANSRGGQGLMQLNKNTAAGLANDLAINDFDIFDFEDNARAGIYHLYNMRTYWREQGYGDEDVFGLMLISYNRGLGGCQKYIDQNGIVDDKYVQTVLAHKEKIEQQ